MRKVFLTLLAPFFLLAQSPGAFTATGSMTTPRASHTATLLTNGKVLIAGGFPGCQPLSGSTGCLQPTPPPNLASAELYDPSTRTFTPIGNMITARAGHSAVLLADGRVLVVGGNQTAPSAELYDPSTGVFSATGNLTMASVGQATLLPNGSVLLLGSPAASLYDPATGIFTDAGAYASPNIDSLNPGASLPDGRVLIGCDCRFDVGAPSVELYDPSSGTFSLAPAATRSNVGWWVDQNTVTLLINGTVLVVGSDEYSFPADAELYDPSTGTLIGLGRANASHEYSAAALLPDGTVLIAGSQLAGGAADSSAELYHPDSGIFSTIKPMGTPRFSQTATLLGDGEVLMAGGYSPYPGATSSAELYTPAVLVAAPALFSLSGDGTGAGAIWHAATGQIASADNPATAGEALSMYTTSLGSGGVIPPQIAAGGKLAKVLYFGDAPGYPGYNQVNFALPTGVTPGSAIPVRLTYLGRSSNAVTIGVR
jgi:hypothetical protein